VADHTGSVSRCVIAGPVAEKMLGMTVQLLPRSWLGLVTVGCWTYDHEVVGSTLSRVTIKWLLLRQMTVRGLVNQHQSQLSLLSLWGR